MAIFGKTKEQPTFAERLSAAKSVFKQAFDDATVLNTELEGEIGMKQKEIESLKEVQKDTLSFIIGIFKLLKEKVKW